MTLSPEIEAQILRYFHAEKWKVGTISSQLQVHHSVVTRVLAQAGLPRATSAPRPSQVDPYLPFIRETLARFPRLTASRLYAMVCERGYSGRPDCPFVTSSRCTVRVPRRRPICACAPCRGSRRRWIGGTSGS